MFGRKSYGNYGRSETRIGRKLILLLVCVGLLIFGYFRFINYNQNKVNTVIAEGAYEEAQRLLSRIKSLPFSNGRGEHGLGALALVLGDEAKAESHFAVVLEQKTGALGVEPNLIFEILFQTGRYQHAETYRKFLESWRGEDDLRGWSLDFATVSLAAREPDRAAGYLEKASPKAKQDQRYQKLSQLQRDMADENKAPLLLDRNSKPILVWDLDNKAYSFVSERLFTGWQNEQGPILDELDDAERFHYINTTIDLNLQKAAFQAMRDYQGVLIIADPANGEVLAAYGTEDHPPFSTTFEPGSVIKVLTYGAFLEVDGDTSPYAPRKYPGNMEIGGKIFYDWTTQGQLETVDQGMAVSCNLMFAQMGNSLGWSRWNRGVVEKFFDGSSRKDFIAPATYGRLASEPDGAYELGRAAIGLDFLETSVLGLIQIPLAIGNNGKLAEPRVIRNHTNIDGQVCKAIPQSREQEMYSPAVASELMGSLVESVTYERGTARRARVDFVDSAMKTGTAGDRPFDSIMIGLVPAEQPSLAFSLYLDKGGKCEINGARVAKRLLEQIRALAPEYLEKAK